MTRRVQPKIVRVSPMMTNIFRVGGTMATGYRNKDGVAGRLDLVTVSEANAHEHWRKRQKRAKQQRFVAHSAFASHKPQVPCIVYLTRVSPRALDDDNLQGALKHVRDGVADALGINDRDPRVMWRYDQRKGDEPKEKAVMVRIVEHSP